MREMPSQMPPPIGFSAVADRTRLAVERLRDRKAERVAQLELPRDLDQPLSQPDATGFSVEEPACTDSKIEGQPQPPSTGGPEAPPLVTSPDSSNTAAPTISRSVQV